MRQRKALLQYMNTCVYVCTCVCVCVCVSVSVSKYSYMHARLSELYTQVFQLEETENGVKLG